MGRLWVCVALACIGCGSSDDSPAEPEGEGGGSGSSTQASGGSVSAGGAPQAGGSSMSGAGGGSGGSAPTDGGPGKAGSGGAGGGAVITMPCTTTPRWTDVSTPQITQLGGMAAQSYPGGCSGTVVNRLTGDVVIKIIGFGMWKSVDKGSTWARIDQNKIDMGGGRCETGWAVQVDQDDPKRMAVFTLDGSAGYTTDGTTWKQWTHAPWGRNWDHGSVDWSSPDAQTIIGIEHEKGSQVVALSTDGGTSWKELMTFDTAGGTSSMVGAIDAKTLIGSRGNGILRSTDTGATWTSVSTVNPLTHTPVRFKSKFYLTTNAGLLVSADQGATWQPQGVAIPGAFMMQGPFFGADENTMVVGTNSTTNNGSGTSSIYKSTDAGAHWTKVIDSPKDFNFVWFGGFSWDPIHDLYYTTRMTQPAMRLDCTSL